MGWEVSFLHSLFSRRLLEHTKRFVESLWSVVVMALMAVIRWEVASHKRIVCECEWYLWLTCESGEYEKEASGKRVNIWSLWDWKGDGDTRWKGRNFVFVICLGRLHSFLTYWHVWMRVCVCVFVLLTSFVFSIPTSLLLSKVHVCLCTSQVKKIIIIVSSSLNINISWEESDEKWC